MWVGAKKARKLLGLTEGQFKRRVANGKIAKRKDPDHASRCLYEVDGGGDTTPPAPRVDETTTDTLIHRDGYVYDPGRRLYVLSVPSQRAPLVMPRERVEAIWAKYAGDQATIAEVCREFALSRRLFQEIKSCLGLTKTRAPWTDETIEEEAEDELGADLLRAKERRILAKAERAQWDKIKRVAEGRITLRRVVQDAFSDSDWTRAALPATTGSNSASRALVVGWTDVHVGKRPHGSPGSLDRQRDELLSLIADVGARAEAGGPWRTIYVPIGSDLLHADGGSLQTSRGTPQGGQSVGSITMHLRLARDLTAALIDRLAQLAPVVAFSLRGNHDETLSEAVALALEERYRHCEQVHVDTEERRRKTFAFQRVPLIFSHGDKIKAAALPLLVATETPTGCDPRRAVVFRGHFHQSSAKRGGHEEVGGFDVVQMASPSPADDWHHEQLFDLSQRRLTLAVVDAGGLERIEWARVA